MSRLNKSLAVAAVGLSAAFLWLFTRRGNAQEPGTPALPGSVQPPGSDTEGGTADEPAPESPASPPAIEGNDRLPRYSTAMVSTARGPEYFEKEYDEDTDSIRWINFKNPSYGTYRDINTLAINHTPMQIYTSGGAMLWQAGQFTPYAVQLLALPGPGAPLSLVVGR